jgi:ATP-binding cassette subfamily C protein CydD
MRDAGLWLLDEPTAHLDPDAEAQVIDALLLATHGRTVIAATHSAALARRAGTVMIIADGMVQTAREVMTS